MLFRLDDVGVLLPVDHPLAAGPVPVAALAGERLLLGPDDPASEFDEFVNELCRGAGFPPRRYPGSVTSAQVAADLVHRGRCVQVLPSSGAPTSAGLVWQPLLPAARYPWSVLWRADDEAEHVSAFLRSAAGCRPSPAGCCRRARRPGEPASEHPVITVADDTCTKWSPPQR